MLSVVCTLKNVKFQIYFEKNVKFRMYFEKLLSFECTLKKFVNSF